MPNNQSRPFFCPVILILCAALFGCGSGSSSDTNSSDISGTVITGNVLIGNAIVSLYSTAVSGGTQSLAKTLTRADGTFRLSYKASAINGGILFLVTNGGELSSTNQAVPPQYSLTVVINRPSGNDTVVINDRTTVATAFALAQFIKTNGIKGSDPGLSIAATMITNLVDSESGEAGTTIGNNDNDPSSPLSALKTLNEMANLLASCATDADICDSIMQLALPLSGPPPADTFHAAANMARTPWRDPVPLFDLVDSDAYQQDLGSTPPAAWTLSLKFKGDPVQLAGPGNMAFDSEGQMWIANNLVSDDTFVLPDCGSQLVFKMDPGTGEVETFMGGGLYGAGYGIGISPVTNDIWVGNYGFKGTTCFGSAANNSVSQISPEGVALSPDATLFDIFGNPENGGWTNGGIGWPQGTVANSQGDIWIASCNGSVTADGQVDLTVYFKGNPDNFIAIRDDDLVKPFDIAFDTQGIAWVSGTLSDNIQAYEDSGFRVNDFDLGTDARPMGVASDSLGNIWVSLSGQLELPCPDAPNKLLTGTTGVAMVNSSGVQINTRAATLASGASQAPGGMTITWGIAVDGANIVWIANFQKGGLSSVCGADTRACPAGFKTGDALSPDSTGYHSDLLDRNTAVEIDSSGNVWLANNWKDLPIQTDPAGDSMVVFIGLATPVKTPLNGTPETP